MVTSLTENQVFVFGSNLNGWHAGGAARQAFEQFGAKQYQATGLQGQSYAIPTLGMGMAKMPLSVIKYFVDEFAKFAGEHPEKEFLLTPIGTGIAGFTVEEIKSILPDFPSNVKLVGDWEK